MADEEGEQLLTVDQVARRLQLHPATIRRWIKAGRLRGISLGSDRAGWRIRRSELEQFIAGMHQPELPSVADEPKRPGGVSTREPRRPSTPREP
jgi:excisionase family DNA binding protein